MIVTEDEARELWCPMARVIVDSDGSYNRSEDVAASGHTQIIIPQSSMCLASGCAMWRWHDETTVASPADHDPFPMEPAASEREDRHHASGTWKIAREREVAIFKTLLMSRF